MLQPNPDNRFPPIIRGKISEIYPWIGFGKDHLIYLVYYLRKFFKINLENQPADRIIKNFFNCPNIYLLDSCRSAILVALKSLGLKHEEEVLITAFTCPAVAESIIQAGGVVKFVEINSQAGLDLTSIKNTISPKTRGIIVTHSYGLIDDLEKLTSFCQSQKLFLINDLAQTLEDPISEKRLNAYGDLSVYSFGPEKHLFALGGGALVTHQADLVAQIEKNLPKETVSDWSLFLSLVERWKYYFTFFALKYLKITAPLLKRLQVIYNFSAFKIVQLSSWSIQPKFMHPIQKSILARKLISYSVDITKTIENFNQIRNNLKAHLFYSDQILPLYATLRVDAKSRFEMARYLAKKGVQTVWNYLPLYKADNFDSLVLPETEQLWQKVLSIPFRYPMTTERVNQICGIINSYVENANSRD